MALVTLPRQLVVDINGEPRVGARMFLYDAGTNNTRIAYTSKDYTIQHNQPILASEGGIFPVVEVDPSGGDYKVVVQDSDGVDIYTEDRRSPGIDALTASNVGGALYAQTDAEETLGILPTNFAYPTEFPSIDVRRYGASPLAVASVNDGAIEKAVSVAYQMGGAQIQFVAGVWSISRTIVGKPGVFFLGAGPNTYYGPSGTTLKPTSDFSGTEVIRFDPADVSSAVMSGGGLSHIAIDMNNVAASGKSAILLRSVSNTRAFHNITVLNQDDGNALRVELSGFGGALPSDGLEFVSFFTYSKTVDYASLKPKVFISSVNECAFRGCKFQHRTNTVQSGSKCVEVGKNCLGTTFDSCGFAGAETGIFVANADTDGPAEHIRVINSIFESYRYGVYVRGALSTADQNFWAKRVIVEPGNRFLSAQLANPRNVVIDRAVGCQVWLDEFIGGGSGTPYLVELTANATACIINAQPSQVLDAGSTNIVMGRNGAALEVRKVFTNEGTFTLTASAGLTGSGTARYTQIGNNVTLYVPTIIAAASGTAVSFSGIPVAIRPARNQFSACLAHNNTVDVPGMFRVNTDGTVNLYATISGAVTTTFSNTGNQGIEASTVSWSLL